MGLGIGAKFLTGSAQEGPAIRPVINSGISPQVLDLGANAMQSRHFEKLSFELGAETDLLIACAQLATESERLSCVNRLLGKQIDWTDLLKRAQFHGVLPLLDYFIQLFPKFG